MKPARSILDKSFRYVPAISTSVAQTWRRFGWQPATDAEHQLRTAMRNAFDLVLRELRRREAVAGPVTLPRALSRAR